MAEQLDLFSGLPAGSLNPGCVVGPAGYRIVELKHEDGGLLVLGPKDLVVAMRHDRESAVRAAHDHAGKFGATGTGGTVPRP